jgi:molybdate transport system substrate-binding protein
MKFAGALLSMVIWAGANSSAQTRAAAPALNIAAASDLSIVMKEIAPAFEKRTGMKANVSFGASGNFYAQILNGAPFDVFLSADIDYPRRLIAAGAADANSLYVYAIGRLVLWMPSGTADLKQNGLKTLLSPLIHKIAIANPEHAPYGRAAVAALRNAGIYDQIKDKLVLGENISQAAQFVQSGNADAGLIPMSLTKGMQAAGKFIELPAQSYPTIEQAAVITKSTPNRAGVEALISFLKSQEGRTLLQRYGFDNPPEKP